MKCNNCDFDMGHNFENCGASGEEKKSIIVLEKDDGLWLYVDGIFVVRNNKREVIESLSKQIEDNDNYIRHYAGVFKTPFEIVDFIVERDTEFQSASLIAETTLDVEGNRTQTRYVFSGNMASVSCCFRFTIISKEYADKLQSYILSSGKTKDIKIEFSSFDDRQ